MKILPDLKSINELFGRDINYLIPDYQRPYSWDCIGKSERNNQINTMWEDLIGFYDNKNKDAYFFGSMVVTGKEREFEVIDGQQRLTSMILLFVAIRSFLKDASEKSKIDEIKELSNDLIADIEDLIYNKVRRGAKVLAKKVKVKKNSSFDYDSILESAVRNEEFNKTKLKIVRKEDEVIGLRYFNNRDYFKLKLQEKFLKKDKLTIESINELNDFFDFLKNNVEVVRIVASEFEVAYHIFEVLNNRGLPLANKDLLRNFIMKEFDKLNRGLDSRDKWDYLESNFTLRDDFIGRWVESIKASQQRYSAFNDLNDIYSSKYKKTVRKEKIELFYDDLKTNLQYYTDIIELRFKDPFLRAKINFILNGGNVRYGLNFLLALSRSFNGFENGRYKINVVLTAITKYEQFITHSLLVSRFTSGPVYKCISLLNEGNLKAALQEITLSETEIGEIKKSIDNSIQDNFTAKIFISKYIWIKNAQTEDDIVIQQLNYEKSTLEHIIPQEPKSDTNWLLDFSPEFRKNFTYRLGNMTLLSGRINSSVKNFDFDTKKEEYKKTKLPLTVELVGLKKISEKYMNGRHSLIVKTILKDLQIIK
ncbi:MAG: DUF262 domain-containing protein [Bacteroidota bacterium]